MDGIGKGCHGLTQHVDLPVRGLATLRQTIEAPRGRPHDVAARLIVLGVDQGLARTDDQRAHEALGQVVARVVVASREILLQDVGHDVVDTRHHVILRDGVGKLRVEDGKVRIAEVVEQLQFLLVRGDDRSTIHFRSRARHGQHHAHGRPATVEFSEMLEIVVPRIALLVG